MFTPNQDRLLTWEYDSFFALYVIHKILAPAYYLVILQAVLKLGLPKWYNKTMWVSRFQAV